MNASNSLSYEIESTCRTLGRMCGCWPIGGRIIVDKIAKHLPPQPFRRLTTPVISALTYIGNDALNSILWPHVAQLFSAMDAINDTAERSDVICALLDAATLFYNQENCDRTTHNILLEQLAEKLIPLWKLQDSLYVQRDTGSSIIYLSHQYVIISN